MAVAAAESPLVPRLRRRWEEWRVELRRRRLSRGIGRVLPARSTLWLLGSLAGLLAVVAWSFVYLEPAAPGGERTLDELGGLIAARQVSSAVLLDEDARIAGQLASGEAFWTAYPRNDGTAAVLHDLSASGAVVRVDAQTAKAAVRTLLTVLLPLMLLANLFALFFAAGRGSRSALGEIISFGQLGKGKLRKNAPGRTPVTFADVAGLEEAVVELAEVVDYLRSPERYQQLGANPPKGVLLFGPPGCGKTLLARAVAGEAGVPFFSVAGAEFVESLVGVGAARVRDLFARVRAVAPAIVFIDELDAAGRRRGGAASGGGADERDQTLNQMLVEMDGFDVSSGIVVMAATNRPDILDPALLRPGRFDRHITIEKPDLERRQAILQLHASRKPVEGDVDFARLARQTPGFSGADLANVVNEAALLTIREGKDTLSAATFAEAVQRVLTGPQCRGHLLLDEEKRRLAAHEAGHALVLAATGRADEVHRISILARGRGLGTTWLQREEEPALLTRSQLHARLASSLGGMAAEELLFSEPSTSSEQDLATATEIARDIVGRYGMSKPLGRFRLLTDTPEAYLDGTTTPLGSLAPQTHALFDTECRKLIDIAFRETVGLITAYRAELDSLIERLLQEETLEGNELGSLLPGPRKANGNGNGHGGIGGNGTAKTGNGTAKTGNGTAKTGNGTAKTGNGNGKTHDDRDRPDIGRPGSGEVSHKQP